MNCKLDHINLTVGNLDQSIEWYKTVFGLKLVESGLRPDQSRWAIVAHNDSMICLGEIKDRLNADSWSQKSHHMIHHFGIRVANKSYWEENIALHEIIVDEVTEYPHSISWYVRDPSGHLIEVSYCREEKLKFPAPSEKPQANSLAG